METSSFVTNSPWRKRLIFWAKVFGYIGPGLAGTFAVISYFYPNEIAKTESNQQQTIQSQNQDQQQQLQQSKH